MRQTKNPDHRRCLPCLTCALTLALEPTHMPDRVLVGWWRQLRACPQACRLLAPWGPHPFSPPTRCPNASGFAIVAPSATLASSTLAVLLEGVGASPSWCRKTAQGRESAYTRRCQKSPLLCTVRYHDATKGACTGERTPKVLTKGPLTGHSTVPRHDMTQQKVSTYARHFRKDLRAGTTRHRDATQQETSAHEIQ